MAGSPQADIWVATFDIYQGFLAGDRARIDGHLHSAVTLWDSEETEMICGLGELDVVRARRPASGPQVVALDAVDPVIDVWGETALARHWLTVRFAGDQMPPQTVRVTAVWRLVGDRWLAVHNHEDVRAVSR